jgi:hypothetical protein
MVNIFLKMRESFVFTGNFLKEPGYYELPISQSPCFRRNTVILVAALIAGASALTLYWGTLPLLSRFFLIVTLLWIIGVWVRTITDHAKIQKRLADTTLLPLTSEELLKEAAGGANAGTTFVFAVALFLILGWLITLAHFERVLASCGGHLR